MRPPLLQGWGLTVLSQSACGIHLATGIGSAGAQLAQSPDFGSGVVGEDALALGAVGSRP